MKILFLSEAVSLAHIGRPLKLAQWAYENGIEVHFAASNSGIQKTNADTFGFKTHAITTINENTFYDRVNHCKFFYKVKELKQYVKEEINLIKKINPDLIVSDFRLTAAISAELTGKQLLNLSNAYWCPNYSCKFPPPETGIFNLLPSQTNQFLFNFIRPYFFKFFGKELNQTRSFYGLKKKTDFRELYTDGNYTAYMDLPNFVKINQLPNNHFFLGPVIWSPNSDQMSVALPTKDYVYISMGSSGNNNLIPKIINCALQNNLKVILSGVSATEKRKLLDQIPELIGSSIIEPILPAEEILPYCKLTICHGGSGTVYQSISNGVPVLCFPKNPDQSLVSMAVEDNNIGRHLTNKNATDDGVNKMIKECLENDLIKQNTLKMQTTIKEWDTKKHWVQFLNKFKTIRKIKKITA